MPVFYSQGEKVEARFEDEWHKAKIRSINVDGTFDIEWEGEGTQSRKVASSKIRSNRHKKNQFLPSEIALMQTSIWEPQSTPFTTQWRNWGPQQLADWISDLKSDTYSLSKLREAATVMVKKGVKGSDLPRLTDDRLRDEFGMSYFARTALLEEIKKLMEMPDFSGMEAAQDQSGKRRKLNPLNDSLAESPRKGPGSLPTSAPNGSPNLHRPGTGPSAFTPVLGPSGTSPAPSSSSAPATGLWTWKGSVPRGMSPLEPPTPQSPEPSAEITMKYRRLSRGANILDLHGSKQGTPHPSRLRRASAGSMSAGGTPSSNLPEVPDDSEFSSPRPVPRHQSGSQHGSGRGVKRPRPSGSGHYQDSPTTHVSRRGSTRGGPLEDSKDDRGWFTGAVDTVKGWFGFGGPMKEEDSPVQPPRKRRRRRSIDCPAGWTPEAAQVSG